MRIGLICDTHGSMPALEAAIGACRAAGCDLVVHAGDFLSAPFSPDPPAETIALLRSEQIPVVLGNNELYARDWGTDRWAATLAQRRQRPDSPDHFLPFVAAGQAELDASDLAWLRAQPEERVLTGARSNDIYICHGMPGNTFATLWDSGPQFSPPMTAADRAAALSHPPLADADLILCGHVHQPLVLRTSLANGRSALVVRPYGKRSALVVRPYGNQSVGHPPAGWYNGYGLLTHRGPTATSYLEWEITLGVVAYQPRDPEWRWDQPSRRPAAGP